MIGLLDWRVKMTVINTTELNLSWTAVSDCWYFLEVGEGGCNSSFVFIRRLLNFTFSASEVSRADEPSARVTQNDPGEVFLDTWHFFLLSQFFFIYFVPANFSVSCMYIYILDIAEIEYQLTLLPNKTASETFSHKSGAMRSVPTGYLSLGRRPVGDWVNTWHWMKSFTVFFSNRSTYCPRYAIFFPLIAFLEDFISNKIK